MCNIYKKQDLLMYEFVEKTIVRLYNDLEAGIKTVQYFMCPFVQVQQPVHQLSLRFKTP